MNSKQLKSYSKRSRSSSSSSSDLDSLKKQKFKRQRIKENTDSSKSSQDSDLSPIKKVNKNIKDFTDSSISSSSSSSSDDTSSSESDNDEILQTINKKVQNRITKPKNPSTKAPKQTINAFKRNLNKYDLELDKIIEDLTNKATTVYESSIELRRKAQLRTEEKIADIKIANGFDINDEESMLPPELQLEIEALQKKSDDLIDKTEEYDNCMNKALELSESKKKDILVQVDLLKGSVDKWNNFLNVNDGNLEKIDILRGKIEFNYFSLKEIYEKINALPVNEKKMEFVEQNEQALGSMLLKEIKNTDTLNVVGINYLIELTHNSISQGTFMYGTLDNGTYVISGYNNTSKDYILAIYDPVKKLINKSLTFENKIKFKIWKNQVVAFIRYNKGPIGHGYYECWIEIMNENLNKLKGLIVPYEYTLVGLNESFLYIMISFPNLDIFDWSLNKVDSNVKFQTNDNTKPFYLDFYAYRMQKQIIQIEQKNNNYIISDGIETKILNEKGIKIKSMENGSFVIDSKNNIIILKKNTLYYYNLDGELIKNVTLKGKRKFLKEMTIDSNDQLHFASSSG